MPASMRISVDLPAPFSPTSAWISPRATSSDAPRLACTGPNDLTMSRETDRRAAASGARSAHLRARHHDVAGDDVLPELLDARADVGGDQRRVVLVVHVADAVLGEPELIDAALEACRPSRLLDRVEDRDVDALHHRASGRSPAPRRTDRRRRRSRACPSAAPPRTRRAPWSPTRGRSRWRPAGTARARAPCPCPDCGMRPG